VVGSKWRIHRLLLRPLERRPGANAMSLTPTTLIPNRTTRIFVAGHGAWRGVHLPGPCCQASTVMSLDAGRDELDLLDPVVRWQAWFCRNRPEGDVRWWLAAAKVGGILANSNLPRRLPCSRSEDPEPCDRERLAAMGRAGLFVFSQASLHLPKFAPPARSPEESLLTRAIGAHQRLVNAIRQDRSGHRTLPGPCASSTALMRSALIAHQFSMPWR